MYSTQHQINFTERGDLTSQAIEKTMKEFAVIYNVLNKLRKLEKATEGTFASIMEDGDIWWDGSKLMQRVGGAEVPLLKTATTAESQDKNNNEAFMTPQSVWEAVAHIFNQPEYYATQSRAGPVRLAASSASPADTAVTISVANTIVNSAIFNYLNGNVVPRAVAADRATTADRAGTATSAGTADRLTSLPVGAVGRVTITAGAPDRLSPGQPPHPGAGWGALGEFTAVTGEGTDGNNNWLVRTRFALYQRV
jgi:hypothetical protein